MDFGGTQLRNLGQASDYPDGEIFKQAIARLLTGEGFSSDQPGDPDSAVSSQPVRFAIIDSHKFTRECVSLTISKFFVNNTTYEFRSIDEFFAAPPHDLSIIIYHSHASDLVEPGIPHIIARAKDAAGDVPLIWMSDVGETQRANAIRVALGSGAHGYIPTHTAGLEILFAVIRFVEAGGSFAPIEAAPDDLPAPDPVTLPPNLNGAMTSRQMEVLALITEGKANKIIAHQLGMSDSTVKAHVRNIIRMMGVRNRTQVACNAQAWIAAQSQKTGDS